MNGLIISCLEQDFPKFSLQFPFPIEIDEMTKICKLINDYFDGECVMDKPAKIKWDFYRSHYWITLPNSKIILITYCKIRMKDLDSWVCTY
jgi:hypothetical protein